MTWDFPVLGPLPFAPFPALQRARYALQLVLADSHRSPRIRADVLASAGRQPSQSEACGVSLRCCSRVTAAPSPATSRDCCWTRTRSPAHLRAESPFPMKGGVSAATPPTPAADDLRVSSA